jgi:hypothetical protein
VNRTLLFFVVAAPVLFVGAAIAERLELSSWAGTGVALLIGLAATLLDREGFYG